MQVRTFESKGNDGGGYLPIIVVAEGGANDGGSGSTVRGIRFDHLGTAAAFREDTRTGVAKSSHRAAGRHAGIRR